MKMKISKPSKQGVIRETKDYLMIALGMILYGIGWTLFLLPNDITTGGVPGIASIVYFATGFPVQYTYFAINAVLLMVSLKVLGFRFSLKTIFGVFTLTFFLSIIQKLTANVTLLHDQPFMACVGCLFLRKWHRYCFLGQRKYRRNRYHCGCYQQIPRHHSGKSHADL